MTGMPINFADQTSIFLGTMREDEDEKDAFAELFQ
jgi:hypothetical protein